MRPDPLYLYRKFKEYNELYFEGQLPPIELRTDTALRRLGAFLYPKRCQDRNPETVKRCRISVNRRYDLPESEVEDTLIHEMIHYYVWYHRLDGEPPHGPAFCRQMERINALSGRCMKIRGNLTSDQRATDRERRPNYICVSFWNDGHIAVTVCAKSRVFDIHGALSRYPLVKRVEWYWSLDTWFNRFPRVITPKAFRLSQEDYDSRFHDAVPCECDGRTFRSKGRS